MPTQFHTTTTTASTTTNRWFIGVVTGGPNSFVYTAVTGGSGYGNCGMMPTHQPEAVDRARELLLSHLTDEQRRTFENNGWFVVEGGRTGGRYRIRQGYAGNVDVLDGDLVSHKLCAHADPVAVPWPDQMLAQKLMLEIDEDDFLAIANRHAA